jgi:hypothetical protein
MTNKRGQIPWKIIGIILALAVLAIFIYALATGTNPLFDAIGNFGGGKVNVQQVVSGCQQKCITQSTVDYCGVAKEVVFEKGGEKLLHTCKGLEIVGVALDKCTGINEDTCTKTKNARLGKDFKEGAPLNSPPAGN